MVALLSPRSAASLPTQAASLFMKQSQAFWTGTLLEGLVEGRLCLATNEDLHSFLVLHGLYMRQYSSPFQRLNLQSMWVSVGRCHVAMPADAAFMLRLIQLRACLQQWFCQA